jgi:hypothetical protein
MLLLLCKHFLPPDHPPLGETLHFSRKYYDLGKLTISDQSTCSGTKLAHFSCRDRAWKLRSGKTTSAPVGAFAAAVNAETGKKETGQTCPVSLCLSAAFPET